MLTPEQRYTKARSIPPSEWDWLRDYPVELNNIRFYDGEIRIDTQHGGEILISPDDVDANTVEKLVIESFIDHYAPEVESYGLPLIEWPSEEDRMWIEQNPETSITGTGFPPHHFLHIKPGIRYKIDISKE